jgi:malate dehydrogenase (oxaloacetate-decarboxylating)(NADP+)
MAELNAQPVIFALSNPTSKSECTAEQAYRATGGRAVFASGSPFPPITYEGHRYVPAQGNNAYIFPGLGLGVMVAKARRVTDAMFQSAARALADSVSEDSLSQGQLYPPLRDIRAVSERIAAAVAEVAWADGIAATPRPRDLVRAIRALMWDPCYSETTIAPDALVGGASDEGPALA